MEAALLVPDKPDKAPPVIQGSDTQGPAVKDPAVQTSDPQGPAIESPTLPTLPRTASALPDQRVNSTAIGPVSSSLVVSGQLAHNPRLYAAGKNLAASNDIEFNLPFQRE